MTVDAVITANGSGNTIAIEAANNTVVLGASAAAVSNGLGVQADNLTLQDGFNNKGQVFTATATGTVSVGAVNLTGATNSSFIKANDFVLTGNANIGGVVIDGGNSAVNIDLNGKNLTATSNINNGGGLTIDSSGGRGYAELTGLADSFTLTGFATVQIDGSNFTNSDIITIDGTNAVLVVGGTGTAFNGDVATTATAKLARANGADITDSGIQVQSASGTYKWCSSDSPLLVLLLCFAFFCIVVFFPFFVLCNGSITSFRYFFFLFFPR